jgi:hypothetical protein
MKANQELATPATQHLINSKTLPDPEISRARSVSRKVSQASRTQRWKMRTALAMEEVIPAWAMKKRNKQVRVPCFSNYLE